MNKRMVVVVSVLFIGVICLPVLASSARRLTFDELIIGSDRVVEATVTGVGSAWASDNRRIYTTFTFETQSEVAGTGEKRFDVVQPGGKVGRWAQITHGYLNFKKGDRVVLFLEAVPRGYRVVGLCQGVFGYFTDESNDAIHQKLVGLHFPDDHGWPMVMDRLQAFEHIRTLFAKRRTP
jgi:hypothetical protein